MKLVEVIRGEKTSDETWPPPSPTPSGSARSPIVVNDGPGFLVNRLLFPYMNEALELLAEGASIDDREGGDARSACRWGRSRCSTWSASTPPSTPAA
jgi:hypothetical protein